jgi:hypothetical protein
MNTHSHQAHASRFAPQLTARYLASQCFDGALQLFDHGHIQTAFHARMFKTGELCIPGHAPEYVAIRFFNFQFNAVQDRLDAVYTVLRNGQCAGEYFASTFRHLWL